MNEFDFIRQLREQIRSRPLSSRAKVGIGDDAAVIKQSGGRDLVITTDLLVEGIDFHPEATPPGLLGHKALAVSLSDVAAMGARPRWSLVSVGFPKEVWNTNFKDDFFAGYLSLADRYGITLAGGDVSESSQIVIDSIVVGEVNSGRAVLRSTARPGDQIFVTGTLGGAAAGLKLIELGASPLPLGEGGVRVRSLGARVSEPLDLPLPLGEGRVRVRSLGARVSEPPDLPLPLGEGRVRVRSSATGSSDNSEANTAGHTDDDAINSLLLRQLCPEPRVGWGIVLGEEQLATSMIDISDGLSSDLHHLCGESHVGATIDAASLPLDENVVQLCGRRALDPLALALHGGEDFELLFTVASESVSRLPKRVDGVAVSRIGEITQRPDVVRIREKNREWDLKPGGYEHFNR